MNKITRVEVIDQRLIITGPKMEVETELQDGGKTLKIFLSDGKQS